MSYIINTVYIKLLLFTTVKVMITHDKASHLR